MFGLNNKTLLWKNASQIIALLIMAAQIVRVELLVTIGSDESDEAITLLEKIFNDQKYQSNFLVNTQIGLCAAQINLGNFEKALELLSIWNYHDNKLAPVIEHTYDNNVDNIDKILQFLFENFECEEKPYTILFEIMKKRNDLNKLTVLDFYVQIFHCPFKNLTIQVKPHYASVIENWGAKIRSGNDENIDEFISKWPLYTDIKPFFITDIVDKVYNNDLHNYKNTINFLNKFSSFSTKMNGYSALLHQMTINNHLHNEEIFEFAFLVKKMEESNQLFDDSIRLRFPVIIRKLVWKETCTMKNIGENEYLYAAHEHFLLRGNRRIFTWIPGDAQYDANWIFEHSGCSTCFFIKNTYWASKNYLTIDADASSFHHRSWLVSDDPKFSFIDYFKYFVVAKPLPSTVIEQKKFTWKLEPRNISNENVFVLHNLDFDYKHLKLRVSEVYDSERRTTFLAQYDSSSDFHWKIE